MACPICKAASVAAFKPFCSSRCADVDLGRWMRGSYAVPSQREDDIDELEAAVEAALQGSDGGKSDLLDDAELPRGKKPH